MHTVADAIDAAISIPLLHIADAVSSRSVDTVALLGTRYTMEQPFLRERLGIWTSRSSRRPSCTRWRRPSSPSVTADDPRRRISRCAAGQPV
ncbi:MAG: aspartate/glutamate racemase family protein [Actinobacteria bacterium]|nr:aspartate/glutamate racemase family protein [Actinomycetota bacterium]